MQLIYIVSLISIVNCSSVDSEVLKRRRRFAELFRFWMSDEVSEEYAEPEKVVKFVQTSSPYENLNTYEYHGRPAPLLARLMNWDRPYDELGPTVSRLLGLGKVGDEERKLILTLIHVFRTSLSIQMYCTL